MRGSILSLVALFGLACNTVPKSTIPRVEVPAGLTAQQVEFAVLASLATDPPPAGLTPQLEITDRALKAWFGWRYQSTRQDGKWFLESRRPGRVTAGVERGAHYLRLAITYDPQDVRFAIDDSRNLRESDERIHKTAMLWIQELEIRIRRSLGHLVVQ